MEGKKKEGEAGNKLTYEQLEAVASQLSDQAKKLYERLQEANMSNAFRRLDYLFKVVEFGPMFPDSFVERCAGEIQAMMYAPEGQEDSGDVPEGKEGEEA